LPKDSGSVGVVARKAQPLAAGLLKSPRRRQAGRFLIPPIYRRECETEKPPTRINGN
jgi:hypothetical protein